MLIAVASVKGAPGVTTLALGLAALWPEPGAVLVGGAARAGAGLGQLLGDALLQQGHRPLQPTRRQLDSALRAVRLGHEKAASQITSLL